MARADTDPAGMTPLQVLILERMRQKGWDAKQVEDRGVKHATLHRYMNPIEMKQLPRQAVIQALAGALDLNEEDVLQAAKDSVAGARVRFRSLHEFEDLEAFKVSVFVERHDGTPPSDEDRGRALALLRDRLTSEGEGQVRILRPVLPQDLHGHPLPLPKVARGRAKEPAPERETVAERKAREAAARNPARRRQ